MDEEGDERVRLRTSLARSLKKEQDATRAHRVAHQRYTVQTIAAECGWQKDVAAAIADRWSDHKSTSSPSLPRILLEQRRAARAQALGWKIAQGEGSGRASAKVWGVKGYTHVICNCPMKCFRYASI